MILLVFTGWGPESLQVSWVPGGSGSLAPGNTALMTQNQKGPRILGSGVPGTLPILG